MTFLILTIFFPVSLLIYFLAKRKFSYWTLQGITGPPASLLQFGNLTKLETADATELELSWIQSYGKVYGIHYGMQPILTVAEPALIKQLLLKDFYLFVNRRQLNTWHKLFNNSQFFAEGEAWKRIRTINGPTFTSAKLRKMLPLMNECVDKLKVYFNSQIQEQNGVIQAKKVSTGFAIDVISSTVFATETNANNTDGKLNRVVTSGLNLFESSNLRILAFLAFPRWLNNLTGVQYPFEVDSFEYLTGMVREIIRQRRTSGDVKRDDFVQLLMVAFVDEKELMNSKFDQLTADLEKVDQTTKHSSTSPKATLTEDEIIAQCLVFFVAGFETTAATLTNAFFELAQNQDIQQRLKADLLESVANLNPNSDLYFEAVMNKLPYLDAVVKETLRKYPPLKRLERRLTGADEYRVGGALLKKDMMIQIPALAIHHNSDYYPEPERFNPERFMPENRHLLVPYTYLPFGAGPRNCIGMRFAYQEIKLCLAKILVDFSFETTLKTPAKLAFKKFKPTLNVEPFELKVSAQ